MNSLVIDKLLDIINYAIGYEKKITEELTEREILTLLDRLSNVIKLAQWGIIALFAYAYYGKSLPGRRLIPKLKNYAFPFNFYQSVASEFCKLIFNEWDLDLDLNPRSMYRVMKTHYPLEEKKFLLLTVQDRKLSETQTEKLLKDYRRLKKRGKDLGQISKYINDVNWLVEARKEELKDA